MSAPTAPSTLTASTAVSENAASSPSSPLTRGSSPSPSVSPNSTLLSCPSLDRSFSANSESSDVSHVSHRLSTGSRSSSGSAATAQHRRGYVRPQGAQFADSAKNRGSVMALGSIAHVQHYFARTGMLDGKGAQLAREDVKKRKASGGVAIADAIKSPTQPSTRISDEIAQSPIDMGDDAGDWDDEYVLPPTVSTYNHREQYVAPPPDMEVLRSELKESLTYAVKALADVERQQAEQLDQSSTTPTALSPDLNDGDAGARSPNRGLHEILGTHILDVVTLAIKAAREYYLMHANPQLLAKVKSEKQIREELLAVMDVLRRMATRHFSGGLRPGEIFCIKDWVRKVEDFLTKETVVEEQEKRDRASWTWLDGDWIGRERLREWEFLKTFVEDEEFPEWDSPDGHHQLPTPFLRALSNGLTLIHLHNRILQKSKRKFGKIDTFHTNFAVPYRAIDNLRYWIKAAELRWELKLKVDVLSVVYNKEAAAWLELDNAIRAWCRAVREEITRDWKQGSVLVREPVLVQ